MWPSSPATSSSCRSGSSEIRGVRPARNVRSGMYRPEDFPPVHGKDHFRILLKRKWTGLTFFSALVGSVALYLAFTEPSYEAKLKFVLKPPPISPLVMMSEIVYSEGVDIVARRTFVATQFEVLKSRSLAEKVMDRLDLWKDYGLGETRKSGFDPFGPPRVRTREGAAAEFAENVQVVTPNIMSNHAELYFKHRDPDKAARVTNALLDSYVEFLYEDRARKIRENLAWLHEQFEKLGNEVIQADQALQDFRKDRAAVSVDERENILLQKLLSLNTALTQARIARIAAENAYLDAKHFEASPGQLERAPTAVASNPQIAAILGQINLIRIEYARTRERYQDKHPRMLELRSTLEELETRLKTELLKSIDSLKISYELAKSQEESLAKELEATQAESIQMAENRIEYYQLLNASKVNRTLYDSLLTRLKETSVLQGFQNPHDIVQIIDKAVPPDKPGGYRPYFLPVACGVGLLLGFFLCYVKDYFDTAIENERDVRETLGLPVLEVLPYGRPPRDRRPWAVEKAVVRWPGSALADHLERLAQVLDHLSDKRGIRSLLVTSTGPREGRTSVAANLALLMARGGKKVLLVDGDGRRPRLHELFSCRNECGLLELVAQDRDPADAIRSTDTPNLFLLPAGSPAGPGGLAQPFQLARLRELFQQFHTRFDRIVVDSPALLEVGDGTVLAAVTDAILWVVASGRTPREKAFWVLQSLSLLERSVLGIALNKVRFLRGPTGYYSGSGRF